MTTQSATGLHILQTSVTLKLPPSWMEVTD